MEPISNRQRRTIFAIAGTLGMDEDTLHDLAFDVTGKQSLRALTCDEALRLIRELEKRQGPRPPKPRPAARKKKDSAPPASSKRSSGRMRFPKILSCGSTTTSAASSLISSSSM